MERPPLPHFVMQIDRIQVEPIRPTGNAKRQEHTLKHRGVAQRLDHRPAVRQDIGKVAHAFPPSEKRTQSDRSPIGFSSTTLTISITPGPLWEQPAWADPTYPLPIRHQFRSTFLDPAGDQARRARRQVATDDSTVLE